MEPAGAGTEVGREGCLVSAASLSAAAPLAQDSETTQAPFLSDMRILELLKSQWSGPQGAFLAHPQPSAVLQALFPSTA